MDTLGQRDVRRQLDQTFSKPRLCGLRAQQAHGRRGSVREIDDPNGGEHAFGRGLTSYGDGSLGNGRRQKLGLALARGRYELVLHATPPRTG
jgi:hypothetical protein